MMALRWRATPSPDKYRASASAIRIHIRRTTMDSTGAHSGEIRRSQSHPTDEALRTFRRFDLFHLATSGEVHEENCKIESFK